MKMIQNTKPNVVKTVRVVNTVIIQLMITVLTLFAPLNLPMTWGVKLSPQADLFITTAEPLGVKRRAFVTFPEYVGATRRHLFWHLQLFPVIQYGSRKTESYFCTVCFK
jgi:hypothetical protein